MVLFVNIAKIKWEWDDHVEREMKNICILSK
jgi:hypothetical protein